MTIRRPQAALLGLVCIGLGGLLTRLPQPELLVVAMVVGCGVLWAAARWGALGILVILVAVTPLLPVVSGVYGQPRSYGGVDGSTLRIVGIGVLSIIALMLEKRDEGAGRGRLSWSAGFCWYSPPSVSCRRCSPPGRPTFSS